MIECHRDETQRRLLQSHCKDMVLYNSHFPHLCMFYHCLTKAKLSIAFELVMDPVVELLTRE